MDGVRIGMRWWLAVAFALIATLTAVLIAIVASRSTSRDLQERGLGRAVERTLAAGFEVAETLEEGRPKQALASVADSDDTAVFVFSPSGRLTAQGGLDVRWQDVPRGKVALSAALGNRRFAKTFGPKHASVVSLPVHLPAGEAAVVAYAPKPPGYPATKAIFHTEIVRASIWAVLVAAATGLVAAILISRRLRRIARSAVAIEQGDFDRELTVGFRDEIGVLADTIDRMRRRLGVAFAQLGAERDRFEQVLEQLQEGVLAVDERLRVQFANQRARMLLAGVDIAPGSTLPESAAGLPLRLVAEGLFAPGAEIAEARSQVDGTTLSLVGVPASASELVVLVVADITKQERLRQAEHDFASNASHELRTPVAAIIGAVEALKNGAADDPASRERFVSAIGRQAARLSRLTSSLLILARVQTNQEDIQLERVDVRPLLEEVVAVCTPAEGVDLRIDCPPDLTAYGRRDVLEQIVSNLVENGLKHTSAGAVVLRGSAAGTDTLIEVSDTGPGIPAAEQGRIFERFYSADRSRRDGFGLGLAIARDSTEAIGGSLVIESSPRGTTARVALPGART